MDDARRRTLDDAYAAFNRGEIDAFLELLDPAIRWLTFDARLAPLALRGREAVRGYFDGLLGRLAEFRSIPLRVVAHGDVVVVVVEHRGRAATGAHETSFPAAHLWRFGDDDLLAGFRLCLSEQKAHTLAEAARRAGSATARPDR